MNNLGIDYGLGLTNVDTDNGIRYGVISINEVIQAWGDSSEGEYGKPCCPNCFNEVDETADFSFNNGPMEDSEGNEVIDEYFCTICEKGVDENDPDIWPEDPICFFIDDDEYSASQSQADSDIFILRSPYYTLCQFCSPCAPGAGYIINHMENGVKSYCFGHDWFEGEKAPYPVYSVNTNELINA